MSRYSEVLESIFTSENKYTVLQLLKALISAIEEMAGHTVTTIDLEQTTVTAGQPTDILVRFTFDDDTTDEFTIVIPPGARGYSITSAEITADNHLVVTFGDGSTEDAGTIRGSKLYRHVINIQTQVNSLTGNFCFDVIDGNENYEDEEDFFNNYIDSNNPGQSQIFFGGGVVITDAISAGSRVFANRILMLFNSTTNTFRIRAWDNGNNMSNGPFLSFSCTTEPLSLVAKGDKGDKGKYIEVTAINAAGAVTEAGQRYSMVFTEKDPANPSYSNTYDKQFVVPRGPQGSQGAQGPQGTLIEGISVTEDGMSVYGNDHTLEVETLDPATGTRDTLEAIFHTSDRRVVRTGTVPLTNNVYEIILPDIANIFYPIIIRLESQGKFDLWCAIFDIYRNEQSIQQISSFRTNKLNLDLYGCSFGCEDNTDPSNNYIAFDLPQVAEPPSSLRYTIEYEKYVPYLEGSIIEL